MAKMIGVTLRYKWITWAMFMVPGLRARPPIREAIFKMNYHLDWARWLVAKTHRPLCSIKKRRLPLISRLIQDTLVSKKRRDYTGEYTFFSYMPGVITVERFLHWWQVASRDSR